MYHRARTFGLRIITKTPLEPIVRDLYGFLVRTKANAYDKQTIDIMKKVLRDNSNCIDVGAYRGEILKKIIKIAPKGKHFAFEPVPENYEYLRKNFTSTTVHNVALSNKSGQMIFNHVVGRPARSGLKELQYPDMGQKIKKIPIQVERLDMVVQKNTPIDFIKIDVEGAELGVLKGAKAIIKKYKPCIVFEHNPKLSKYYGTRTEEVYDLLVKECGMKVYDMSSFLADKTYLSKSNFTKLAKTHEEFNFVAAQ